MTRAISLSSFFLLLLFGAALWGGCQNAGPEPLPRPEHTDFPSGVTRLSLDLPGHFTANPQPMAILPEAASFIPSMTRYQTNKETGLSLQIIAVRFDVRLCRAVMSAVTIRTLVTNRTRLGLG